MHELGTDYESIALATERMDAQSSGRWTHLLGYPAGF